MKQRRTEKQNQLLLDYLYVGPIASAFVLEKTSGGGVDHIKTRQKTPHNLRELHDRELEPATWYHKH